MSINIDSEQLREALFSDPSIVTSLMRSIPLKLPAASYMSYDGTWLTVTGAVGNYPAIQTGHAFTNLQSGGYGLTVTAIVKVDTDSLWFALFLEPYKGNFENYLGLDARGGAVHYARTRKASVETATDIDPQDWTSETELRITHEYDESDVWFYVDGVEVAHHTTNISSQPYEVNCCEPDGGVRACSLKYPPGLIFGGIE